MSRIIEATVPCPKCKRYFKTGVLTSVNVSIDPKLKEALLKREINKAMCPFCKKKFLVHCPLMYHDMDNQFAVWYNPLPPKMDSHKPTLENSDNYVLLTPEIKVWDEFIGHIMLFENQIEKTPVKKRLLNMKHNYNYENLGKGIKTIAIEYLPEHTCKHCKKRDTSRGLADACVNCDKDIKDHTPLKLIAALEIFRFFCASTNTLDGKHQTPQLLSEIDKLTGNYHFTKQIDTAQLGQIRKTITAMEYFGSAHPGFMINFKKGKPNVLLNGPEALGDMGEVWGMGEVTLLLLTGSANMIFTYGQQPSFFRRLFK